MMESIKNRDQYKEQIYSSVPVSVLFFPTSDYMSILFQEDMTQYGYREQIYGQGNTTRLLYHTDLNDPRARGDHHGLAKLGKTFPELHRLRKREKEAAKEEEEKTKEEEKGSVECPN